MMNQTDLLALINLKVTTETAVSGITHQEIGLILSELVKRTVLTLRNGVGISIDVTNPDSPIIASTTPLQVNSDWNIISGVSAILNKPVIPVIPANVSYFVNDAKYLTTHIAQIQTDWNATAGLGVLLNKPVIPVVPTNVSAFTNDAGYITTAGPKVFSAVDQGKGIGIIVTNRIAANYGPIGKGAFDVSTSYVASITRGATGLESFAAGQDSTASGEASFVVGNENIGSGHGSFVSGYNNVSSGSLGTVFGYSNKENGYANFIVGIGNEITNGAYATLLGQFGQIVTNNINNVNDANNTMLSVGNGNANGTGTLQSRSTAFLVKKNGAILAPSLGIDVINADVTGRILISKEYLESKAFVPKYKSYQVQISQTALEAPVVVNSNATEWPQAAVWTRISAGLYRCTFAGNISLKAAGFITNGPSTFLTSTLQVWRDDAAPNDSFIVRTLNNGVAEDGILVKASIEFRLYN